TIPTIGYVIYFLSDKSYLKFRKFRVKAFMFKEIFSYGFPASLSELSTGFCILVFNLAIGKLYGEEGLAAFSVIAYVMTFVVNTMLAVNQSSQPLLGFYYGAREYENIPILRGYMLRSVAILSVIMVFAIEMWPEFFINVFLTDVSIDFMTIASRALRIFAISFLILGFNITNGGYLTSVGRPRFDFIITLLRGYVFVAIFSYIVTAFMPKETIWYVLSVSDFITMLVSVYLIKKELVALEKEKRIP
ncbi:MAG: MATE family efflux transporter, partial [Peptoniphilus grossensis]